MTSEKKFFNSFFFSLLLFFFNFLMRATKKTSLKRHDTVIFFTAPGRGFPKDSLKVLERTSRGNNKAKNCKNHNFSAL